MKALRYLWSLIPALLLSFLSGLLERPAFGAPPTGVLLIEPANGSTVTSAPFFTWAPEGATWYYVWISRNGSKYLDAWVQGTTSYVPDKALIGGDYTWWVRPWNADGFGPWSFSSTFSIPSAIPQAITPVSPTGSTEVGTTQQYMWEQDSAATWYELYITRNGKLFSDQWYSLSNLSVPTNGCLAASVNGHHGGTYQWWVRGWSPDGMGSWSSNMTMQIPSYPPAMTTLLSPLGGIYLENPMFIWTAVSNASWYQIYIRKDGNYYYSTWLQGTNWVIPWDISTDTGNYEWSVMAWNEDGMGTWTTASFREGYYPPGAAQDLHIENWNGQYCDFVWSQGEPWASYFYIQVWRNEKVIFGRWTQDTSCTSPSLLRSGFYEWCVLTWNEQGGYGPWNCGHSFYIYGF